MSLEEQLIQAREYMRLSQAASEEAKAFIDAGYPKRLAREKSVEELRNSVDQLIQVVDKLVSRTKFEKR